MSPETPSGPSRRAGGRKPRDWAGARGGAVAGDGAAPAAVESVPAQRGRVCQGRGTERARGGKRSLVSKALQERPRLPGKSELSSLEGFSSAGRLPSLRLHRSKKYITDFSISLIGREEAVSPFP